MGRLKDWLLAKAMDDPDDASPYDADYYGYLANQVTHDEQDQINPIEDLIQQLNAQFSGESSDQTEVF